MLAIQKILEHLRSGFRSILLSQIRKHLSLSIVVENMNSNKYKQFTCDNNCGKWADLDVKHEQRSYPGE